MAAVVLTVLTTLHFLFTLIHVIPDSYFPDTINRVVKNYMMPVFHQGWNLFAPDPPLKEKSMVFRVKTDQGWSEWLNPGAELLQQHDQCRLSNANIAFRLHQNAAYRLWEEHYRTEELSVFRSGFFDPEQHLLESRGYRSAKYYVSRYFSRQWKAQKVDTIQLRLLIDSPPPFPGRDGNWIRNEIHFPPDAVE